MTAEDKYSTDKFSCTRRFFELQQECSNLMNIIVAGQALEEYS